MDEIRDQSTGEPEEREEGLSLDALAERVGVPVRTIRFYISQGLLPGPGSRGKSATYGEAHVIRLRLIRRLADQHVPLTKIAALVEGLTLDDAQALLAREEQRASELQAAEDAGSPKDYVAALLRQAQEAKAGSVLPRNAGAGDFSRPERLARATFDVQLPDSESASSTPTPTPTPTSTDVWRRWTLVPGIELHVRGDALARYRDLIRRLLSVAGVASDSADE
jgi:DNA-binding transcriptional MerR regulator